MPDDYGLVCIDEDVYKNIKTELRTCCDELDRIKAEVTTIFSSSNEALVTIFKAEAPVTTYIEGINQKVQELNARIQLAIDQYNKIDEDSTLLLSTFNDYLDELFSSALNEASLTDFDQMSFDERMEQLNLVAQGYESVLNQLRDEFERLCGQGVPMSIERYNDLHEIFTIFDVYRLAGIPNGWSNTFRNSDDHNYSLDPDAVIKVLDFCWDSGILDKIDSYLNGASWVESGLNPYYTQYAEHPEYNEELLLKEMTGMFNGKYKTLESLRIAMQPKMEEVYETLEMLSDSLDDYYQRINDITILNEKVHQLKAEIKLLPFEQYMKDTAFYKFLEKNYTDYNEKHNAQLRLEFMSQEEVALYDYLTTIDMETAKAYLDALQEKINERAGFQEAVRYVQWINEGGATVSDGFKSFWEGSVDGLENFGEGLINILFSDGIKGVNEYAMMYKTILMDCSNEYNDQLTEADRILLSGIYDSGKVLGEELIPALANFVPVIGKPLSEGLKMASKYGNTTESMRQQGYTESEAKAYSLIKTGLNGLSDKATKKLSSAFDFDTFGSKVFSNYLKSGLSIIPNNLTEEAARKYGLGERYDHLFDNPLEYVFTNGAKPGSDLYSAVTTAAGKYGANGFVSMTGATDSIKDGQSALISLLAKVGKTYYKNVASDIFNKFAD